MTDPTCSTHGWSIVSSASSHAALAAVLAGFGFTAAVIYMGRAGEIADETQQDGITESDTAGKSLRDVQTIALFTASFIILALDSFLFSLVAGSRSVTEGDVAPPYEMCGRVWNQALIALGMLALGAAAMVCNITSMFLSEQLRIRNENSRQYLRSFLLILTAAGMVAIILLHTATSLDYLDVVYDTHIPIWFAVATLLAGSAAIGLALYLSHRSYNRKNLPTNAHDSNATSKNRMKIPTALIVIYAGLGPLTASVARRLPNWPEQPVTWVILAYWTIGFVLPISLIVWLAHGIQPGKPPQTAPAVGRQDTAHDNDLRAIPATQGRSVAKSGPDIYSGVEPE